jgi:hypothetical protein
MDTVLAVLIGIGLASSCGFRVFLPLLVVSAASYFGYFELAGGFDWLGTWAALVALAVAAIVEIAAYYVPWLDNALDLIASPIVAIAGTVMFAASVADLDPFLQWSLAIIAGGGSASIVQGGTVLSRLASTATTGGLANFVVATLETLAGLMFSILSIVVPLVALLLLIMVVVGMYMVGRPVLRRLLAGRDDAQT